MADAPLSFQIDMTEEPPPEVLDLRHAVTEAVNRLGRAMAEGFESATRKLVAGNADMTPLERQAIAHKFGFLEAYQSGDSTRLLFEHPPFTVYIEGKAMVVEVKK